MGWTVRMSNFEVILAPLLPDPLGIYSFKVWYHAPGLVSILPSVRRAPLPSTSPNLLL